MMRMIVVLIFASFARGAEAPSEGAWKILMEGNADSNAVKRKEAVAALEAIGPNPKAIAMVEEALVDKDIDVRQTAATVLCSVQAKSSIPKLKAAMDDPTPEISFAAARALWCLGDRSGRDILIAVAEGERSNSSGLIKEQMRDAMKKLHNPSALAMIGLREGAGAFLGPAGIGFMVMDELRKDGSASARTVSVTALAKDPDPKTLDVLADALNDKNWIVRVAAAKAMATRGDRAAIPKLERALTDKNDAVRYMAAATIIHLDGRRSKAKRSGGPAVRQEPTVSKQ